MADNTTSAAELEKLVVSLVGEDQGYNEIMQQAETQLADVVDKLEESTEQLMREQNRLLEEAARITQAVATPTERYADQWKTLKGHLEAGRISQETFNRALNEARKSLPRVIAHQEEHNRNLQMAQAIIEGVATETEQYSQRLQKLDVLFEKGYINEQQYNRAAEQLYNTLPRVRQAQEQVNRELQRAAQITQGVLSPTERYAQEVKELDTLLKRGRITQETYNRALAAAKQQLPEVRAAQEALERTTEEYNRTLQEAERLTESLRTPSEQYAAQVKRLNELHAKGFISLQTYNRGLKALNAQFHKSTTSLSSVGQGLQNVGQLASRTGMAMTAGITVPVTAMAYNAVGAFGRMEQGLLDLQAAANPTEQELALIRKAVMQLSKELGMDPAVITGAFSELLKAGVSLETVLDEAAAAAVQFARVGQLTGEVASTILADSLTVFGESANRTVNILSSAADASSISIGQIAEAFAQASAVAGSANQSLEDVAAAIAVLGNYGVKGSDAGTSLKTMLLRLMAPADKAAQVIEQYGLNVRDSNGQMRPFVELIGELQSKLGVLDQETRDNALFDLFGQDAIRAAQIFIKTGTDGFDGIKESMDGALTVAQKYQKQMEGLHGSWTGFLAAIERFSRVVGGTLATGLSDVIKWLTGIVDSMTAWVEQNPGLTKLVAGVLAIAAALGPIVLIAGGVITAIGGIVAGIAGFLSLGGPTIAIVAAIVAGLVGFVVQVTAVAAAIAGLTYYIVGSEGLAKAWDYATTTISNFFKMAVGFISNFSTNMKVLLDWLPRNWDRVVSDILGIWLALATNMIRNLNVVLRTFTRLWYAFGGWLVGRFQSIFTVDFIKAVLDGVVKANAIMGRFAMQAWEQIKAAFTGKKLGSGEFISQLFNDFLDSNQESNFLDTAGRILKEEAKNLVSPLANFKSSIEEVPDFVFDTAKKAGEAQAAGIEAGIKAATPATVKSVENLVAATTKKFNEEADENEKATKRIMEKLREEADTYGMTKRQIEVYRLAKAGATAEQIKEAQALADKLDAQDKEKKIMEEAAKVMERYRQQAEKIKSPQEKFNKLQEQLKDMLGKNLITVEAFTHEMKEAKKDLEKETRIKFKAEGLEAIEHGTQEMIAQLEEARMLRNISPTFDVPDVPKTTTVPVVGRVIKKIDDASLIPSDDPEVELYNRMLAATPKPTEPKFTPETTVASNEEGPTTDDHKKRVEELLERIANNTQKESVTRQPQQVLLAPAHLRG